MVAQSLSENCPAADLFSGLVRAEDHHEAALMGLYREITNDSTASAISAFLFSDAAPGETIEGGVSLEQALSWSRGKGINDILDISIALESHSYDLYIRWNGRWQTREPKEYFLYCQRRRQRTSNVL